MRAKVNEAREKILDLAEGSEGFQKSAKRGCMDSSVTQIQPPGSGAHDVGMEARHQAG